MEKDLLVCESNQLKVPPTIYKRYCPRITKERVEKHIEICGFLE